MMWPAGRPRALAPRISWMTGSTTRRWPMKFRNLKAGRATSCSPCEVDSPRRSRRFTRARPGTSRTLPARLAARRGPPVMKDDQISEFFHAPRRSSSLAARALAVRRCASVRCFACFTGAEALSSVDASDEQNASSASGAIIHRPPTRIAANLTRSPPREGQPKRIQRVTVLGLSESLPRAPRMLRHTCETVSNPALRTALSGIWVVLVCGALFTTAPPFLPAMLEPAAMECPDARGATRREAGAGVSRCDVRAPG